MSESSERNRLVVPGVAVLLLVIIVGLFWVTRGDDAKPEETSATPTPSATATSSAVTAKLTGSGEAPEAIALGDVTVARSAERLGLAADVPDIDLKQFDEVLLTIDQGETTWRLSVVRDPRGAFISPQLYRDQEGESVQYACGATLRVRETRLTMSMPLTCLDEPQEPLTATFSISDQDGAVETTVPSKSLKAFK